MGMEAAVLLAAERKSFLEGWSLAWFDMGKLRVLPWNLTQVLVGLEGSFFSRIRYSSVSHGRASGLST